MGMSHVSQACRMTADTTNVLYLVAGPVVGDRDHVPAILGGEVHAPRHAEHPRKVEAGPPHRGRVHHRSHLGEVVHQDAVEQLRRAKETAVHEKYLHTESTTYREYCYRVFSHVCPAQIAPQTELRPR